MDQCLTRSEIATTTTRRALQCVNGWLVNPPFRQPERLTHVLWGRLVEGVLVLGAGAGTVDRLEGGLLLARGGRDF